VRVGDTQKLSRLAGQRVYRFPQAGDRRYGKIEVFKRIGACSVDLDSEIGSRDIRINTDGFGLLDMAVNVMGSEKAAASKVEPMDPEKKPGGKVKEAKEYLSKHRLEVRLSEAMQAVLRERPDDPETFLAQKLLAGKKLQPLDSAPPAPPPKGDLSEPVARNQLAPLKQAAPAAAAPQVSMLPFAVFYKQNMKTIGSDAFKCIHLKFPKAAEAMKKASPAGPRVPVMKPFKAFYTENLKSMGPRAFDSIHAKFASRNAALAKAAPAAAPKVSYHLQPSVGTWMMAKPQAIKALPTAAPAQDFRKKASVGTWIMSLPMMEPEAVAPVAPASAKPAFAMTPSVGTWVARPQALLRPQTASMTCLKGLRRPAAMAVQERTEVERVLTQALLEMGGKLEGDYFPLQGSTSFFLRPGGMTQAEKLTMQSSRLLFEAPPGSDANGRGIFCSASKTVAVQVNTQDAHARFIVFKEGEQAQRELRLLEGAVKQALQQQGYAFA